MTTLFVQGTHGAEGEPIDQVWGMMKLTGVSIEEHSTEPGNMNGQVRLVHSSLTARVKFTREEAREVVAGLDPLVWVPVSERLPVGGPRVLVWARVGDVWDVAGGEWSGSMWVPHVSPSGFDEVTHWRPLPLPPVAG